MRLNRPCSAEELGDMADNLIDKWLEAVLANPEIEPQSEIQRLCDEWLDLSSLLHGEAPRRAIKDR
jgi:hypothetical protein